MQGPERWHQHDAQRRRRRLRSSRTWHRYLGVVASAFVLLLAATGIALNHTETLRLDERGIESEWLLALYGIVAPPARVFAVGPAEVVQVGSRVSFAPGPGDPLRMLATHAGTLVGATRDGDLVLLVFEDALWWLSPEGRFVERVGAIDGMPPGLAEVALDSGAIVVRATDGLYRADRASMLFERVADRPGEFEWVAAVPGLAATAERARAEYRGSGLSVERIVLDLHSGRLFGRLGVWAFDAVGIVMILLALTGVWMFAARGRH